MTSSGTCFSLFPNLLVNKTGDLHFSPILDESAIARLAYYLQVGSFLLQPGRNSRHARL